MAKRTSKRRVELLYRGPLHSVDEVELYRQSIGNLTVEEKLKAIWELVETAWKLKGKDPRELQFCRSVAVVKRI